MSAPRSAPPARRGRRAAVAADFHGAGQPGWALGDAASPRPATPSEAVGRRCVTGRGWLPVDRARARGGSRRGSARPRARRAGRRTWLPATTAGARRAAGGPCRRRPRRACRGRRAADDRGGAHLAPRPPSTPSARSGGATRRCASCAASATGSAGPRGGDDGLLTAREREIAELVAAGRTNREVAAQLVLSEAHDRGALAQHLREGGRALSRRACALSVRHFVGSGYGRGLARPQADRHVFRKHALQEMYTPNIATDDERYYVPLTETVSTRPVWISVSQNEWCDVLRAKSAGSSTATTTRTRSSPTRSPASGATSSTTGSPPPETSSTRRRRGPHARRLRVRRADEVHFKVRAR